jgi:hypothetical protein
MDNEAFMSPDDCPDCMQSSRPKKGFQVSRHALGAGARSANEEPVN